MTSSKNDLITNELKSILSTFMAEQGVGKAIAAFSDKTSFDQQLGIDSLGKIELIDRVEKKFSIQLNYEVIAEIDSLKDLANAIALAKPRKIIKPTKVKPQEKREALDVSDATSLQEVLLLYAQNKPDQTHIYLREEQGQEVTMTYGELFKQACRVANSLMSEGIGCHATVAIMLPTSLNFFIAFFGVLLAGAIPVPIYPPFRANRIEEYAIREAKILNNAEVKCLITFAQAGNLSRILKNQVDSLAWVTTVGPLLNSPATLPKINYSSEAISLIQYTSGSTGDPKGVTLLNRNILANIRSIGIALNLQPQDNVISWLPLYHDMGLMSWLGSLYYGIPITLLSPIMFLKNPEEWLWALHYHQGTISASPNFGYELCVNKIDPEKIKGLDLSRWRMAMNGAEAVNIETLLKFYTKFKIYGFSKKSLFPVYGLAENTVGLVIPKFDDNLIIDKVSKEAVENKNLAKPQEENEPFLEFVSNGVTIANHEVRIVDENDRTLAERQIGHIEFRGPSTMQGYYRNQKATSSAFHDDWVRSGDLGYIVAGNLFVTGRKKDLIIKAGRNLYPEAFETVINHIEGIRKGCVIAFGIIDKKTGTEKVIIAAETKLTEAAEKALLSQKILETTSNAIGVPPDEILFLPPRTIPKTSSGKLQRSACKQAYLDKTLTKKPKPFSWQITKLTINAFFNTVKNGINKLIKIIYSAYAYSIGFITLLPIGIFTLFAPKKQSVKALKLWAKVFLKLIFCKVKVSKLYSSALDKPLIFAPNHQSYMDSVVLITALPEDTAFIGKKELLDNFFLRIFLKKMNFIPVERQQFLESLQGFEAIQNALQNKQSILIFPEGTFIDADMLQPFKTGAFQLAAETGIAIVPIAISGTRKLLPGTSKIFTPSTVHITFCDLIFPKDKTWAEINRLKEVARKAIEKYLSF